MNPFDGLATLALGVIKHGSVQAWIKLLVSSIASMVIGFTGTFGLILLKTGSYTVALGSASIMVSISLVSLWVKSPLTKGIPILYFGEIETARIDELTKSFEIYNENKK